MFTNSQHSKKNDVVFTNSQHSKKNDVVFTNSQHSKKNDVVFTNSQFVSNLEDGLNNNRLHLASESCVFALSVLGKTGYHARPFLSFPICSHNITDQQEIIFEKIFSTWNDSFSDHLINIETDGDEVRQSVLPHVRTETLDPSSPLYCQLEDLGFLGHVTLEKSRTIDFDAKHKKDGAAIPSAEASKSLYRRGAVVKGVEHISIIVLINI